MRTALAPTALRLPTPPAVRAPPHDAPYAFRSFRVNLALSDAGRSPYVRLVYEHRHQPLLSRRQFVVRLVRHVVFASLILAVSLAVGMAGYRVFERLEWVSAFLNSAMLLGGMGPVDAPQTRGGKLFAGFYALYAGLVFIVVGGLVVAPALHRLLHRVHLGDDSRDSNERSRERNAG